MKKAGIVVPEAPDGMQAKARELVAELERRGLRAVLQSWRVHKPHPCVLVTGGVRRVHAAECVYLAPADPQNPAGPWRFWREDLTPVSGNATVAAAVIADAVTCPGAGCQQCGPDTGGMPVLAGQPGSGDRQALEGAR